MARPNRLASRVFKALYFLDCEFLESKLGNNPSYVWRSIWESNMVIKAGARWKVGNRIKVKILNQPWLNDAVNAYVRTEVQSLEQATVAQLLSADGDQWDNETIEDLFNLRDQQCILNTMVGENSEEDVLSWNEDLSGEYTVKSAYQMLQRQKGLWSTTDNSSLWKSIWRIAAPPKVLNMVWHALSNSLPTRTALDAKCVPVNVICPFCSGNEESILHVLVQCPFADQCWRKRGRGYHASNEVSFDRWLKRMLEIADKDDHGDIVTLCWSIWQARNKVVWNQTTTSVNQIVYSAKQFLAEWK